jgi:hypothetical protein
MKTSPLHPFGVEVTVPAGTTWADLDIPQLLAWGGEHGVVVVRGLAPQPADRLACSGRQTPA